jgi:CubicO group peptidase (beta-lactamase class C family)
VSPVEVAGTCDARFEGLREALRENIASRGEVGAAVTAVVDGRVVADLWVGWADTARTRPWRENTVVCLFSVGKALAGLCALRLVDRGDVELDAPLARYWPELVAREVTVRQLLAHRSGLAAIRKPLGERAVFDWALVTGALAEQQPWWEPGAAHGYHVHTFGFLVGELVRRASGTSIRDVLREEIAAPLAADVGYGLAAAERHRAAEYTYGEDILIGSHQLTQIRPEHMDVLKVCAYASPDGASGVGTVDSPAWQDAVIPSANAYGTARGVAAIYAALLDGRLLGADALAEAIAVASDGHDLVLERPSRFGLGFQLTQPERPLGPNPRSFGHFGAGGSFGFADPDAGVACGYTMNHGGPRWQNPRNKGVIDALYASLG